MTTSSAHEMDIRVDLKAPAGTTRETIEDRMIAVLEAVEDHAVDVARDPVVSADFDEGVITLMFQLSGVTSPVEYTEQMGVVSAAMALAVDLPLISVHADDRAVVCV